MLNILEGYDIKALGHNSAAYLHLLAEAKRIGFADRAAYLADPDHVPPHVLKALMGGLQQGFALLYPRLGLSAPGAAP